MRDYAKVSPQFWTGETGRKIKEAGTDAVIVAMYLMTSPHANMIGLYHLPTLYLAHETGLTIEGASKGLRSCIEADFCTFDDASEHVFVHEMARFQIGEQLDAKDKRCKGVANELEKAPKGALRKAFEDRYRDAFHLAPSKGLRRPKQAPTKPRAGTGARTGTGTGEETSNAREARWARFRDAYPRHTAMTTARKVFDRLDPDDGTLDAMLAAISRQRGSSQWAKDDGQFIPHPATWLNQRRWEDETGPSRIDAAAPAYMAGAL